ncbi:hypothetical protein C8R45DRAFT_1223097 [Mycena sanguinolenta]|nr:hypothetical protein C8R45DRAFT_1223097 [Mycena sanguinolenta]
MYESLLSKMWSAQVSQFFMGCLVTDCNPLRPLCKRALESLTLVMSQFRHLECLDFLINRATEFTDTLDHAHFKNFFTFRLNATVGPLDRLHLIHLPNLTFYDGPSFDAPFFNPACFDSVTYAWILLYPEDADIDTAFARLVPMTMLDTLSVLAIGLEIKESAVLAAPMSHADTLEITAGLANSLSFLLLASAPMTRRNMMIAKKSLRETAVQLIKVYDRFL